MRWTTFPCSCDQFNAIKASGSGRLSSMVYVPNSTHLIYRIFLRIKSLLLADLYRGFEAHCVLTDCFRTKLNCEGETYCFYSLCWKVGV